MHNGMFHDDLLAYDIAIIPELEQAIGSHHVQVGTHSYNGHVVNSRYDDQQRIIGDVVIDGVTYLARQESFLGQRYWLLVSRQEEK